MKEVHIVVSIALDAKNPRVLYAGTLLLLLGYAGSRFVLEVILGRMA